MNKVKILAIAPYEGLRDVFYSCSETFPHVELEVLVGNLEEVKKELPRIRSGQYDVIISRGGTAEMLREISEALVVEVNISMYDMLHIIKTAQQYGEDFVIMGFPNITNTAKVLCEIMHYDIGIYEVEKEQDTIDKLREVSDKGISLVVGDVVTVEEAQREGYNTLLISSGPESVTAAIKEAYNLHRHIERTRNSNLIYKSIIDACPFPISYMDSNDKISYANEAFDKFEVDCMEKVFSEAKEGAGDKSHLKVSQIVDGKNYDFTGVQFNDGINCGAAFYVSNISVHNSTSCLRVESLIVGKKPFCLFDNDKLSEFQRIVRAMVPGTTLQILGEAGSGKETLARYVHTQAHGNSSFYVTLNCEELTEENWEKASGKIVRLLLDGNCTLFLRNVIAMNINIQRRLSNLIVSGRLTKSNTLICSSIVPLENLVAEGKFSKRFFELLNGLKFSVPALREYPETIPAICSLLVGEFNILLGKQVIGFEPEALRMMVEFDWILNATQLCTVVKQLVATTTLFYIPKGEVVALLAGQESLSTSNPINLTGTLEEIEGEVIHYVFREENMNQTQTAKRLGIGRSTLWRKLRTELLEK